MWDLYGYDFDVTWMPRPRLRIKHSKLPGAQFSPSVKGRFAEEFLLDCDASAAAERVGYPGHGSQLLGLSEVQTRLRVLRMRAQSHTEIYSDAVLQRWWQLATADARELTAVHRVNCRHCHGHDHRYQFTVDELRTARQAHLLAQRHLPSTEWHEFDDLGGEGFDVWGDPNPDCTECGGKGVPQVWVADTRHLSPSAALLYDGVEVTRDGTMRVKMRDRGWADQMVATALGIAIKGREPPPPLDPARMSDEQLEAAIEAFHRAGVVDADEALELAENGG